MPSQLHGNRVAVVQKLRSNNICSQGLRPIQQSYFPVTRQKGYVRVDSVFFKFRWAYLHLCLTLLSLQFNMKDEVWLMNPRSKRQKVALGSVSGFPGKHKFHFKDILEGRLRVDVQDVLAPGVALMFPNDDTE